MSQVLLAVERRTSQAQPSRPAKRVCLEVAASEAPQTAEASPQTAAPTATLAGQPSHTSPFQAWLPKAQAAETDPAKAAQEGAQAAERPTPNTPKTPNRRELVRQSSFDDRLEAFIGNLNVQDDTTREFNSILQCRQHAMICYAFRRMPSRGLAWLWLSSF